jgi:CheY-like chemotaxis protein
LVEDDPATRKALLGILDRQGWEVWGASTLAEALSLVARDPDCVVLDLMLPDGEGTAVLEKIRAEGRRALVVVTTGSIDTVRLDCALRLKPAALLTKPIDLPVLLEVIGTPPRAL